MSRLTKLLEYEFAGNSQKKRILNSASFNNLFNKQEKQLIIGTDADISGNLLMEEITNTIKNGAENRRLMRDILPTVNVKGNSVTPVYGTKPSGNLAEKIAEGSSFPVQTEIYSSGATININKYGTRSTITSELIEDSQFDLIEIELMRIGEKLENKLNEVVIGTLLDNHNGTTPSDVDPGASVVRYEDIGDAYEELGTIGWKPTDLIMRPRFVGQLLTCPNSPSGAATPINADYGSGKLFGINTHVLDTPYNGTTYWDDTDGASHYYGLLLDRNNYGMIAIKQDITVENYRDYPTDLYGIVGSIKFGVGVAHNDAAVRILTK